MGGGETKQESGDFCGWVGEFSTPVILLKDKLPSAGLPLMNGG